MTPSRSRIASQVTESTTQRYIESPDYNGVPATFLMSEFSLTWPDLRNVLTGLIQEGMITLTFQSVHENPSIKRFPDLSVDDQVKFLTSEDPSGICAYPSPTVLQDANAGDDLADRPFARRLALGEAQLEPVFFDLEILERYYADPRYYFVFDGYDGSISVTSSFDQSNEMPERDKVLLQTFGIAYDTDKNRVVVAYLRYLSHLSSEHQQIWNGHLLTGDYRIARAYYLNTIGQWTEDMSIYQAFLEEQRAINEMSRLMGRQPLFRKAFDDNPPKGFAVFFRPTRKNYLEFALLMDKMLSDNIDTDFFQDDVRLDEEVRRRSGVVEVRRRGSLAVLHEWLRTTFRPAEPEVFDKIIKPMKEIRSIRRRPAHKIEEDDYDRQYHHKQDQLIIEAYGALRTLRMMFALHPAAKMYEISEWLREGRVVLY